jgi:hypothetical protein
VDAGRDAYTSLRDQNITHIYGEQLGLAGTVSITPPQVEYPVRGRDEVVAALLDTPGTVHVLCAAGGYGKTTVALAVAEQARSHGMDVWRVLADDAAGLSAGMRVLAVRLGAAPKRLLLAWSGQDGAGDAPDLVWELLNAHDRPWLLVIDNADDPRLLAAAGDRVADGTGWVRRPPPTGRLVVTSRNHNQRTWGGWVRLHRLEALSTEQAAQVLCDRAGAAADTPEQAAALAIRLGHLPLLLHQAGLYLAHVRRSAPWPGARRNPRTFEEYRAALDDRFDELLAGPPGNNSAEPPRLQVPTTWELTLDLLAGQGLPLARPLIRLLAHFANAPIPYAAMLSPPTLAASPLFPQLTVNDLEQAIEALADFGLLARHTPATDDPTAYTVTLHPAISEALRAVDEVRAQRQNYLALAASQLAIAVEDRDAYNPAQWPFWQLTTSHVNRLCALVGATGHDVPADAADALIMAAAACVTYATSAGLYPQAEATLAQAVILEATGHPDQVGVLKLRHQQARLKDHRGDLAGAETEYRAVLRSRTRILGPDHPDTLTTRHKLTWVQAERGDLTGAETEYRALVVTRTGILGPDHPDTLWTRHNLAWVQAQRGDLAGAETEYRAVLRSRTRILGPDHRDTLWTRYNLAWVQAQRGDLTGAETEYRALLTTCTRILGPDHPDTLATRHNLAVVQAQRGDLTGAETEYRALLTTRTRILGPNHPNTLDTKDALDALHAQKRLR